MSRVPALAVALLLAGARPASADITGFLGATTTPDSRSAKGVAVGIGLLVIAFEFEYSATSEDPLKLAPSLKTGMGNLLLQTPVPILRMQPYFTVGGGGYHEALRTQEETNVGVNTGGGVKITLIGPLRLRLDYRVFRLSGALYTPSHRVYAGANLRF